MSFLNETMKIQNPKSKKRKTKTLVVLDDHGESSMEQEILSYYNTPEKILKIIKVQSIIRRKYWFLPILNNIMEKVNAIYSRKSKPYVHEFTVFGDNSIENQKRKEIAFKQKQQEMKEGEVAQVVIGNWPGWEDLGVGHSSGLDCRKKDNSIIIECKNKWNTVKGSDIKKSLLPTLAAHKKENPQIRCVWGIVNPKPGCKKLTEKIIHEDVEIEKIQGNELFKLVFTVGKIDYSNQIISFVVRHTNRN